MPGTIVNIMVSNGDKVKKGQVIAILEAMKMETVIVAKTSGCVKSIYVSQDEMVKDKQLLIDMK